MDPSTSPRILRALGDGPRSELKSLLRRAEIQFAFAKAFAPLFPSEEQDWTERIDRAQEMLDGFHPQAGLDGLQASVEMAEAELAPIGRAAKEYTIHCVGHGHIDMNWMWSWPETVSMTHDTFASVLSLMEQYPEFTYSQSQASVYEAIERYHPDMFEQIRRQVKEGRWEVTAAHWVEGDKNLASGESLARHLLYTRDYFKRKFGLEPEDVPVDWEPDTFGHANTIPTIMAQGGLKYYYCCRPGGGQEHHRIGEERPRMFWWEGPDGSRLLVNRESTWYNSYINIGENVALPMVEFARETGLRHWLNVYGIGNHGGGPTRDEIDFLVELDGYPIYPRVKFSTARAFFDAAASAIAAEGLELPVLDHELNFEFTGCYTSQSAIKKANRYGENYCVEAETLAVLGGLDGPSMSDSALPAESASLQTTIHNPQSILRQAWINTLFNQFHDILPGSGVAATREHALGLFQETGAITGAIKRNATKALAANLNTVALLPDTADGEEERALIEAGEANTPWVAGSGIAAGETGFSVATGGGRRFRPFVVYNPCAWDRTELVKVELYDTDLDPARIVARDETGANHPTLFLGKGHDWGHDKLTVMFEATVPALGYRAYLLCEGAPSAGSGAVSAIAEAAYETPHLRVRFDRFSAGLTEVQTASGRSFASFFEPLGCWEQVRELPRGMNAWILGKEIPREPLSARTYRAIGPRRDVATSLTTGKTPLVALHHEIPIPGTSSSINVASYLGASAPRVDFEALIDWREIGSTQDGAPGLRIDFESSLSGEVLYETPFGTVARELSMDEEVPTLRFAHLWTDGNEEEGPRGLTLVQDSKYGHASDGRFLSLRVLRSSTDPDHAPEVRKSTVRYGLHFHDQRVPPSELARLGAAFNHPFIVFPANLQSGDAPLTRSFARVETPNVVLTCLKEALDGNGLILRLVEYGGHDTQAVVELDDSLLENRTEAQTVDLMERPVAGVANLNGTRLVVQIKAHGFATVRLSSVP